MFLYEQQIIECSSILLQKKHVLYWVYKIGDVWFSRDTAEGTSIKLKKKIYN